MSLVEPGLKSMSEPRKLKSQAISSSIVTITAFIVFFSKISLTRRILSLTDWPEYFSSKWKTLFFGLAGRSTQIASTGLSVKLTNSEPSGVRLSLRVFASAVHV